MLHPRKDDHGTNVSKTEGWMMVIQPRRRIKARTSNNNKESGKSKENVFGQRPQDSGEGREQRSDTIKSEALPSIGLKLNEH